MANGTMKTLLLDAKMIDNLLVEVRDYQNNDIKIAENNCEEFLGLMGEENIAQIQDDIEEIERFKKESDELKAQVWEDRLESNKIQNALVDADPTVDVKEATSE